MRVLVKILAIGIGVIVLAGGVAFYWIFYCSGDLPDTKSLARYAPAEPMQVSDACLGTASVAIPYDSIGENLRAALRAAESGEEDPGILADLYSGFTDQATAHRVPLSLQISRGMFCVPSKILDRSVAELRTAVQLERRFSRRELFTIYANGAWFGTGLIGVEAASQHFFQKRPDQLQIGEAALLAGMLRGPSRLSPFTHPDRALRRRNEVIDAMVQSRAISAAEGEMAKASALGTEGR